MSDSAAARLRELDRLKAEYGAGVAARKLALLAWLGRRRLAGAGHVARLHEILCFLRAYPDSAEVLREAERLLGGFSRRADLRGHRRALADSGIAGTDIHFRFFAPTAAWLACRFGDRLRVDWKRFKNRDRLDTLFPLMALYGETPALDEYAYAAREWVERLKGPDETDAAFLVRRFQALRMDDFAREKLYDALDPPLRLAAGPGTPSRTRARFAGVPVVFQAGPLVRSRPSLRDEVRRPPAAVRPVTRREGEALIDLAREAMVTRSRDMDVFSYGDPDDVRLADCGGGVQFALIGAVPERRLMLEAIYGFLTLRNGVPIGYGLLSALFRSSEVAYNVFETFRGGEAALVFGRLVAVARHMFGSDCFVVTPYQIGEGNEEALRSGAFWFYQKLGFRPRDPEALRTLRAEIARMRAQPGYRSGRAVLRKLARANLYLHLGRARDDVMGLLPLANVGLRVSRHVAERFGSDRERASRTCAEEAALLLGIAPARVRGWHAGERLAWERWAPLVRILPGLEGWGHDEKRHLVDVVRAKGGRRESDFVARFGRHARLRAAVRRLAATPIDQGLVTE